MRRLFLLVIEIYQKLFEPLLSLFFGQGTFGCRFYPTCSNYTKEAIVCHGFWRGILLGAKRLFKCHPFCQGGFDPLP
jgi:hypothetical protein